MLLRIEIGVLLQPNCASNAAQYELAVKQRIDTEAICFIMMDQTFALFLNGDTCYGFAIRGMILPQESHLMGFEPKLKSKTTHSMLYT